MKESDLSWVFSEIWYPSALEVRKNLREGAGTRTLSLGSASSKNMPLFFLPKEKKLFFYMWVGLTHAGAFGLFWPTDRLKWPTLVGHDAHSWVSSSTWAFPQILVIFCPNKLIFGIFWIFLGILLDIFSVWARPRKFSKKFFLVWLTSFLHHRIFGGPSKFGYQQQV